MAACSTGCAVGDVADTAGSVDAPSGAAAEDRARLCLRSSIADISRLRLPIAGNASALIRRLARSQIFHAVAQVIFDAITNAAKIVALNPAGEFICHSMLWSARDQASLASRRKTMNR